MLAPAPRPSEWPTWPVAVAASEVQSLHVAPASTVPSGASPRLLGATLMLLGASVALGVWAAPLLRYTDAAARQLGDRAAYAAAVLSGPGGTAARSAQPYTGQPGTTGAAR